MFVPEIIDKLREEGFTSKAADFCALVYTTCKKLIKRQRVWESKRSGKRSFALPINLTKTASEHQL